ncbi:MAG: RNA polymerase sigma-54 factor [Desulfobacteraceae bacterium]|nr:MAG: RNA polymerase sigma-54 factor [Desulfobacteraceae bacterium]
MALELRQHLKLAQQLVMTPQLQQAIKLLQLSRLELVETVQQELEQNPILEEGATDSDQDQDTAAQAVEAEPEAAAHPDVTPELTFESSSALAQIDWNDYVNDYGNGPGPGAQGSYEEKDLPSRLDILSTLPNLQSHLRWQLYLSDLTDQEEEVGDYVIGNLNRDGFLDVDVAEIAQATGCSEEIAAKLIRRVQEMDPAGVAARSVRECLLLQLERLGLGDSLAALIVSDHLDFLEVKNYNAIARALKCSLDDVYGALEVITELDPHPGRAYSDEQSHYIVPDVFVHKVGEDYVILLNDEGLPRLRISSYYKEVLQNRDSTSDAARSYIQEKLRAAVWLIRSIQQRQRTIYRVVESIVKYQRDFLEKGVSHLRPMVLRDVAEDIEMHESTISRVTTNKYVHTPQGIFELKYFFNSAIQRQGGDALASESVKERIRQIIQAENQQKPLSDNAIAEVFQKESIQLARRTVAKYREQLGILPSHLRKRPAFKGR